jgi:hypothetical protein
VVVAVIAVRMVEVTVDEVVDVIPVRDRLVTAAGPVHVIGRVGAARVRGATRGVRGVDLERVLFDARCTGVVQVTVVHVVDVIPVLHCGVTAAGAVDVIVIVVRVAHGAAPSGSDSFERIRRRLTPPTE